MRIIPNLLFLAALFTGACSDENVEPVATEVAQAGPDTSGKSRTSAAGATSITGLTNFKADKLAIPSTGIYDGTKFYNGLMRGSIAYYPYSVTQSTYNGQPRVRFYVKPTTPTNFLLGALYPYHHRAEITRFPWKICHPLGTEEWLGFSYFFPTKADGYSVNRSPVSIYQNHAGRVGTAAENPPAFQIEIAYPGQLKTTPNGGEIMLVHQIRGIRYAVPGVRVVAGARLNVVMQIVYDLNGKGLWNVWLNGTLVQLPGGNAGSTVWANNPVGGNSKMGIYHHQERYTSAVNLNYSKGHTHMKLYMSHWNDVFRHPGDWDYKNSNAYNAVNTAGYP